MKFVQSFIVLFLLICVKLISARIQVCDLRNQLQVAIDHNRLPPTAQDWLCIIFEGSHYAEGKVTNTTYGLRYGLFQIQADNYCTAGRKGGKCNTDCRDFLDKNLTDDFACANLVYNTDRPGTDRDGFNYWAVWRDVCSLKDRSNFAGDCD